MTDDSELQIIRPNTIAVSYPVKKCLGYVSRALGTNPDQLADEVLSKWMQENHPLVVAHIDTQNQAEKKFKDELKAKLGKQPPF